MSVLASPRIGVIGNGRAHPQWDDWAYQVGLGIAQRQGVLVCGGLSGVMAAAARGAREADGLTIGILPGTDSGDANDDIAIPVATGLGEGRNLIVVQSSQALIAIGGGAGTLSEIGFALKLKKPLVLLGSWGLVLPKDQEAAIALPEAVETPEAAVEKIFALLG